MTSSQLVPGSKKFKIMIEKIRTVSPDPILERSPINEATVAKIAHVNHVIDEVNKAIGGEKPKVYKALLSQSGTDAPTAVILENTLGDIVWTYDGIGSYEGTLNGAFSNKTVFYPLNNTSNVSVLSDTMQVFGIGKNDLDSIYLSTGIEDATGARDVANDVLFETLVLIEVYP
jgi:hypothetical protein